MRRSPRSWFRKYSAFAAALVLAIAPSSAEAAMAVRSEWVYPGSDGKLVYKTTPRGDRILDFSHAGYMGGGVALPDVSVKRTVEPSGGGDDTDLIQAAIDEVSALPLVNGFRGAVLLAPGVFTCSRALSISASGVVLRGSGSGAGAGPKTTLKLSGRPHPAITVRAPGGGRGQPAVTREAEGVDAARTFFVDAYVPSGASTFNVADAKGFSVGDLVEIQRPVTEAWVELLQMHDLTRDNRPQTWMRVGSTLTTEREIVAIAGSRLTVDVPLADSYDAEYLNPPGTVVVKLKPSTRVSQVGIESLHIESPEQEISHSQPHFTALRLNGEDCWVRDVVADETMNSVGIGGRRITLERVAVYRKARHQGASKPAEFAPNGSQVLLDRCTAIGDNVWYVATGAAHSGPIVILNCTFRGNGRAESHQRWTTAMLYDNCRAPEGGIEIRNRGSMGSGHGWSMGWGVVWNSVAHDYIVQNPPGAMNWVIGSIGQRKVSPRPFGSGPNLAEGTVDAHGTPVTPQSLYLTQLAERLGPQALKAIGYTTTSIESATMGLPRRETAKETETTVKTDKQLGENLALYRPVGASNVREGKREFAAWQALDGDESTYWAVNDGAVPASLELDTEGSLEIDAVVLAEAAGMIGRVQGYKVEGFVESAWTLLSQGTRIGERKVDRFPAVTVWKVRLTVTEAKEYPAIREFGLYFAPAGGK